MNRGAILAKLRSEGVDVEEVSGDSEAATGVAIVMVDAAGEMQILTAPGANRRLTVRDIAHAGERIASGRVALLQLEVPLDAVEAAIRLGRAAGARIILDPAPPRQLSEGLVKDVHVIRPNAVEAEALTGIKVVDQATARQAADNLIRRGAGAAIVDAPGGHLLLSRDGEFFLPHLPVQAVDSTVAVDAFAAA